MAENVDHSGHRERMRKRFKNSMSLEGFAEHEVLEMLLYYMIPRKNTNFIAHELIKKFGSIKNVMEASVEELSAVSGISEACAYSIKFIYAASKMFTRGEISHIDVRNFEQMYEYVGGFFENERVEKIKVICINNRFHVQSCSEISVGGSGRAALDFKEMTRTILNSGCSLVALAHNHPNGVCQPSEEDIILTRKAMVYLNTLEITLLDHYITGIDGTISMRNCGFIYDMENY